MWYTIKYHAFPLWEMYKSEFPETETETIEDGCFLIEVIKPVGYWLMEYDYDCIDDLISKSRQEMRDRD